MGDLVEYCCVKKVLTHTPGIAIGYVDETGRRRLGNTLRQPYAFFRKTRQGRQQGCNLNIGQEGYADLRSVWLANISQLLHALQLIRLKFPYPGMIQPQYAQLNFLHTMQSRLQFQAAAWGSANVHASVCVADLIQAHTIIMSAATCKEPSRYLPQPDHGIRTYL
jgi:hypothetical protein